MSILNSDQNKMTKQSGGKVARLVLTMNEVGQPCCEVNVYQTGGNVTDPADGLLLQAARLWQTCTRPNTQCVLESNQPTVDSIKAEMRENGRRMDRKKKKEKQFIELRAKTHQFVFVCLWFGAIHRFTRAPPPLPPPTSFSDEGKGGASKQYQMRLNVLPAAVTTETISWRE